MAGEKMYTADQIAVLARELRQAAGSDEEAFSAAQVVSMMRDEIRILRERGFIDERIAGLFSGFDIDVSADDIERFSDEEPSFN